MRGAVEQGGALGDHQTDVDAGRDLDLGVVHPGLPGIAPALDPERPRSFGAQGDVGVPPVEPERRGRLHPDLGLDPRRVGDDHRGVDRVVTLAEDGGPDLELLADRGLGRVRAALDHRRDLRDRDPTDRGARDPWPSGPRHSPRPRPRSRRRALLASWKWSRSHLRRSRGQPIGQPVVIGREGRGAEPLLGSVDLQHEHGPAGDPHSATGGELLLGELVRTAGVRDHGVGGGPVGVGQEDLNRVRAPVQPDQERIVTVAIGLVVRDVHAEGSSMWVVPGRRRHLGLLAAEPGEVLAARRLPGAVEHRLAVPEPVPAENGMVGSQLQQPSGQVVQIRPLRLRVPVHPRQRRVLAVGVVVAVLGAAALVTGRDHRQAGGDDHGRHHVPGLTVPQGVDHRVLGLAFDAAVPGSVVVGAVPVGLAVRPVVLDVVGDHVAQREPVVGGDEVDAGRRPATVAVEDVGRSGQPLTHLRDPVAVASPEVPDVVAEPVVPLAPVATEAADLVAVRAEVPRLGDDLDPAQHRIVAEQLQERVVQVDLVLLVADQRRHQVEAEAVHAHLGDPVAQRVGHQLQHPRLGGVHRVAAAGDVVVGAQVARQPVVAGVVDPPEGERGPLVTTLAGVVVDHVQDHLEPGVVQRRDHLLELPDLLTEGADRPVRGVRGEEAQGVVAPVVGQPAPDQERLGDEVVDRAAAGPT